MKQTEPPHAVADPTRPTPSRVEVRHEPLGRSLTIGREIGRYGEMGDGPLLIVLGGVHGNEPAGIFGAARVLEALGERHPEVNGTVVALAGNLPALAREERFIQHDLNRSAHPDTLRRLQQTPPLADTEEHELLELTDALDRLSEEHRAAGGDGGRYVIDIHTTSSESLPYVSVFNFDESVAFAGRFPTYTVIGLEQAIHGTLIELLNRRGWTGFTFEAGRHHDLASVEHAEAMIWLALRETGILGEDDVPIDPPAEQVLRGTVPEGQRRFTVIHRHAVGPRDGFVMRPGFVNFQPVEEGQPLADDVRGQIVAPAAGHILMPLYQSLGEDGFFLIQAIT